MSGEIRTSSDRSAVRGGPQRQGDRADAARARIASQQESMARRAANVQRARELFPPEEFPEADPPGRNRSIYPWVGMCAIPWLERQRRAVNRENVVAYLRAEHPTLPVEVLER